MSDLIKNVTPLTRGIIWLVKDERDVHNPIYSEIDYLLDGLLTANLHVTNSASSRVIMGKNFNQLLYVLVAQNVVPAEFNSYVSLFKNLTPENDILIIDEMKAVDKIKPLLKNLSSHLRIISVP